MIRVTVIRVVLCLGLLNLAAAATDCTTQAGVPLCLNKALGTLVTDGSCTTNSSSIACLPTSTPGEVCSYPVLQDGTACRAAAGACDVAEVCNYASSGFNCPADALRPASFECRASPAANCTGSSAVCPPPDCTAVQNLPACVNPATGTINASCTANSTSEYCLSIAGFSCRYSYRLSSEICRAAAGACDAPELCSGTSTECPADVLLPSSLVCRAASVSPPMPAQNCTGSSTTCPAYGFNTNCPAQAVPGCVNAASGVPDATCANSTSAFCLLVNSTGVICKYSLKQGATICRGFAGSCDVQEVCSGQSPECPEDSFQPNTTVCQPASGSIPALFCSGIGPNCPPYGSSTNCSAQAVPACVNATSGAVNAGCANSTSNFCLNIGGIICGYSMKAAGTTCRASAGDCDAAETCNGTAVDCPADAFLPSSTVCRAATVTPVVPAQNCTGSSAVCPAYGSGVNCTAQTVPACVNATSGVPDAGCTNSTSAYCLAISGVTCRYSLRPSSSTCRDKAGDCDVAEQCSGTVADCPADVLLSNATVCRPAAGLVPEQKCTGTSAGCPGYGSSVNCSAQTVPECADPATGTPDAACNAGLGFCLNVTASNVICKYSFRPTSFTCRTGPPATQCPGNAATCPPADPQVPIIGLTVSVNGLCNDNVYNTILASVQGQLVVNAGGVVGAAVKGEKANCTNTNARRRLQQVNIARYSLRFSSNTIADAGILSQLRFTYQNFVNTVKASGIAAAVPGLGAAVTAITNGAGAVQGADANISNDPLSPENLSAFLSNSDFIYVGLPFRVNATLARGSIGSSGVILSITGATCSPVTPGGVTDSSGQAIFSCTVTAPAGQKTLTVSAAGRTITSSLTITAYAATVTVSPASPTVAVGGSVSFSTMLSFRPLTAPGGYEVTMSGTPGVTCTPAAAVTRVNGGATFSCRFEAAGLIAVTASASEVAATATAVVNVTGVTPPLPSPSPSPSPAASPSPSPAPSPSPTPDSSVRCGFSRRCFADSGSFGQACSALSSTGCECDRTSFSPREVCVCAASRGLVPFSAASGFGANRVNTTSCRWDITSLPGLTSNNRAFTGYDVNITTRNFNGRVLFPLPLGAAAAGGSTCPPNNAQNRPWNVVRSITVGRPLLICRTGQYKTARVTSQAAGHYCTNNATFVSAQVSAQPGLFRGVPQCYALTITLTDGRTFSTNLRVTRSN